jgi:hypothetical protein
MVPAAPLGWARLPASWAVEQRGAPAGGMVVVGVGPDGEAGEVGDVDPPEFGSVEPDPSGVEDVDAGAEVGAAVVSAVVAVVDGVTGGLLVFCDEPQPARTMAAARITYQRLRMTAPGDGLLSRFSSTSNPRRSSANGSRPVPLLPLMH